MRENKGTASSFNCAEVAVCDGLVKSCPPSPGDSTRFRDSVCEWFHDIGSVLMNNDGRRCMGKAMSRPDEKSHPCRVDTYQLQISWRLQTLSSFS